jgi:hypothetical protein
VKIGDLVSNQYYGIGIVTGIDHRYDGRIPGDDTTLYRVQFKEFNVGCFFRDLKVLNASW